MLLREESDGVLAIGQASHAWLSGQLARAWGNGDFPAPEPREEVCLATTQHDVGMAEWDLEPSLNPATGRPHSFLEMPLAVHLGLWTAAPAKLITQSSYAALLVSMHGVALYERRDLERLGASDRRRVDDYLRTQRELQDRLTAQLGAPRDQLRRNQQLLWTWDGLSLALCLNWEPFTLEQVPGADGPLDVALRTTGPTSFELDPWPFNDAVLQVVCEARRLDGRFEDEAELHAALDRAPVLQLHFTLAKRL